MIDELQLFRGKDYIINNSITIHHPTLDEICNYGEERYYQMISCLCSTPSDYKVMLLDNFGVDYEQISEFQFFILMRQVFSQFDTSILFNNLDFKSFEVVQNNQNNEIILYETAKNIAIDNTIYKLITSYLREIHGFEKKVDVAGNEHTKEYIIQKERRQLSRMKNKKYKSILIPLISAMINCSEFKYNYETVWGLPIYVFMDSVKRIQKIKNYNYIMQGVYSGTIDSKNLSEDSLNWMGNLR